VKTEFAGHFVTEGIREHKILIDSLEETVREQRELIEVRG